MAEIKTFCGLPWEEAQYVLELYKYKKVVPSEDYADGFKEGIKYAQKLFEDQLQESLERCYDGDRCQEV